VESLVVAQNGILSSMDYVQDVFVVKVGGV